MLLADFIVVADLGCVKAYRLDLPTGHPPFAHPLEVVEFKEARERVQEVDSDATGRFHAQVTQGSVSETGERIGLKAEIHHRLVKEISETIANFLEKYDPAFWRFAAPPEINHFILERLVSPWPDRLLQNSKKNLVNEPPSNLISHFEI